MSHIIREVSEVGFNIIKKSYIQCVVQDQNTINKTTSYIVI